MERHHAPTMIRMLVIAEVLLLISLVVPSDAMSQDIGVITYREGTQQRIYAFVGGASGRLYVNYWDGGPQWKWADQGTPPGTQVGSAPGVITYREGSQPQRIYAFVRGTNGRLYVNYWDGGQWKWADQGTPLGTTVDSDPGVITYRDGTQTQRIYAFVRGANDRLYVNYWDGGQWKWADQGVLPGTAVSGSPGVTTYQDAGTRRIYAFVNSNRINVHVNYWDGGQWKWADQGWLPQGVAVSRSRSTPGVITYPESGSQRVYAFTSSYGGDTGVPKFAVNHWDGLKWAWADQAHPPGGIEVSFAPAVTTYREDGTQRIYAFVHGSMGHLYVNYWDGSPPWKWADQGAPPGAKALGSPGAVTYEEAGKQRIYAFIKSDNGRLYVNYWDGGPQWKWADQGLIGK